MFAQVATASPRAYFCVFIMPNLSAFLIKFTLKDTEYCSFPRLKHVDSRCDLVLVVFQRNPFPNLLKHGVSFSFTFWFVRQVVSAQSISCKYIRWSKALFYEHAVIWSAVYHQNQNSAKCTTQNGWIFWKRKRVKITHDLYVTTGLSSLQQQEKDF